MAKKNNGSRQVLQKGVVACRAIQSPPVMTYRKNGSFKSDRGSRVESPKCGSHNIQDKIRIRQCDSDSVRATVFFYPNRYGDAEFKSVLSDLGDCHVPNDYEPQGSFKHEAV